MGNYYNLLEWDSQFFGYKIASLKPYQLKINELNKIINDLKAKDFRLAYCFVNPNDAISNNSLKSVPILLADEKVTFFTRIKKENISVTSDYIKPYNLTSASEKLKLLTLQSGLYSRFKIDPNFHNNEFEKLYTEWIEKSVKTEAADRILIYNEDNEEKGFITLAINKNAGSIGLIAVDEKERGKSIGKKLIQAAFLFFKERDIHKVEVVTQKANNTACAFYESLGFKIQSITNVYHLWIN